MQSRFWLRFESGEREGERVPIPASGLTLGRRPENGLVLPGRKASGKHARLRVDGERVFLVDLESRNGTWVDGERVEDAFLEHGARLRFGEVEMRLLDGALVEALDVPTSAGPGTPDAAPVGSLPASPPAAPELEGELELELEPAPTPATPATPAAPRPATRVPAPAAAPAPAPEAVADDSAEGMTRISEEKLQLAGKRRPLLAALLVAALLLLAGTTVWRRLQKRSAGVGGVRAVPTVAGNLLRDPGFEGEGEAASEGLAWNGLETASQTLGIGRAWAATGTRGLGATFEGSGLAQTSSAPVAVREGAFLRASCWVETREGSSATLGLRFSDSSGERAAFSCWSERVPPGSDWVEARHGAPVLPGYDRAQLVLAAHAAPAGGGRCAFDDAALVAASGSAAGVPFDTYEWISLGLEEPARAAALTRLDRVLFTGLQLTSSTGGAGAPAQAATVRASAESTGYALAFAGAGPAAVLELTLDAGFYRQGLSTLGRGGYREHALAFEEEGVTSLLLGEGRETVRLGFPEPLSVVGSDRPGGFLLRASGGSLERVEVQLSFRNERDAAEGLAARAREAARRGELGASLTLWQGLLSEYPFEEALVQEAEGVLARAFQEGMDALRQVELDFEEARFFGLADLHAQAADEARALEARYGTSEVAREAAALAEAIEAARQLLERGSEAQRATRLVDVARILEGEGALELAGHVRALSPEWDAPLDGANVPLDGGDAPLDEGDAPLDEGDARGTAPGERSSEGSLAPGEEPSTGRSDATGGEG